MKMKMKTGILLLFTYLQTYSQEIMIGPRYQKIYDARYVQIPPIFPFGTDSCKHYYFTHFKGFDALLAKAFENGDTAKYLRIYFSFIVDKNGFVFDTHFIKITSTRYAKSIGDKTLQYFSSQTQYYERLIHQMLLFIPLWKPAIQDGIPVTCRVIDFLQCWVGITKQGVSSLSLTNHVTNYPVFSAFSKNYLGHYVNHLQW